MTINGDNVDALSFVCHRDNAQAKGRDVAKRLKEVRIYRAIQCRRPTQIPGTFVLHPRAKGFFLLYFCLSVFLSIHVCMYVNYFLHFVLSFFIFYLRVSGIPRNIGKDLCRNNSDSAV